MTTRKKLLAMAEVAALAFAPLASCAEDYSFFCYDEGTALYGYESYDAWCDAANVAKNGECASPETISETGHCTWSVSSGIDLVTKALMGIIISIF